MGFHRHVFGAQRGAAPPAVVLPIMAALLLAQAAGCASGNADATGDVDNHGGSPGGHAGAAAKRSGETTPSGEGGAPHPGGAAGDGGHFTEEGGRGGTGGSGGTNGSGGSGASGGSGETRNGGSGGGASPGGSGGSNPAGGDRPRVIVSTDIGGDDPDDFQSMVHYLVYADRFDTEGLISSPPGAGRKRHISEVLDAYASDFGKLKSHAGFPTPESLRAVTVQGATAAAPSSGFSTATDGSRLIIESAKRNDPRPLYVLVWGSITDVAQAVHDYPDAKKKVRVYSIGSWNTGQDRSARDYLYHGHMDMWWVENDTTFRGMYSGGAQAGDLGNSTFVSQHVKGHGALGDLFFAKKSSIKMGDTPSVLYMLDGDPGDPTKPSWGGMYRKTGHGPNYFHDLTDSQYREGSYHGAKTVNRWREDYLRDWQKRMGWAAQAS